MTTADSPQTPNIDFIKSLPGILKIVELVLLLIALICAAAASGIGWGAVGADWIIFWSIANLIVIAAIFIIHLLNLTEKIPLPQNLKYLAFLIVHAVSFVMWLINFIVCIARLSQYGSSSPMNATAAFSFFLVLVFGVDTFFALKEFREAKSGGDRPPTGGGGGANSEGGDHAESGGSPKTQEEPKY